MLLHEEWKPGEVAKERLGRIWKGAIIQGAEQFKLLHFLSSRFVFAGEEKMKWLKIVEGAREGIEEITQKS